VTTSSSSSKVQDRCWSTTSTSTARFRKSQLSFFRNNKIKGDRSHRFVGGDDVQRFTATPTATAIGSGILKNETKHYIFGYGSLMCPLSRQITNENLMSKFTIPIAIRNLERNWCARTTTGYTAMGVQFVHNNSSNSNSCNSNSDTKRFCTGILIGTINAVELEDLDRREASYHRLPV
jgi:hypothetical protein